MDQLTNEAKYLLSSMYIEYVKRQESQVPREEARNFQGISYLKKHIVPEWSEKDILDVCFELKRHGYVDGLLASNTFYTLHITTVAVSELKVDFKDKIENIFDYLAKIKSAIPFL